MRNGPVPIPYFGWTHGKTANRYPTRISPWAQGNTSGQRRVRRQQAGQTEELQRHTSWCPDCGGMGFLTYDTVVNGSEHDTEERECSSCNGTGERAIEEGLNA